MLTNRQVALSAAVWMVQEDQWKNIDARFRSAMEIADRFSEWLDPPPVSEAAAEAVEDKAA